MMSKLSFQYFDDRFQYGELLDANQKIVKSIGDKQSRFIYENRLLFSLTDNPEYMKKILLEVPVGKELYNRLNQYSSLLIYGAGKRGKRLVDMFPDLKWKKFFDQKETGDYKGIVVDNADNMFYFNDSAVVVSIYSGFDDVKKTLIENGWPDEDIIVLGEYDKQMSEDMYFEREIVPDSIPAPFFVDGGAYDCKDTLKFRDYYKLDVNFGAIAIEPDKESYARCKEKMKEFPNVDIVNAVLSDGSVDEIGFMDGKGEGSSVCLDALQKAKVITIDALKRDVSFIKLDVEGNELETLKGAKETIKSQKPILAISVYHRRSDIWTIPNFILSINPEYKIYFRHYTVSYGDTVLYAI